MPAQGDHRNSFDREPFRSSASPGRERSRKVPVGRLRQRDQLLERALVDDVRTPVAAHDELAFVDHYDAAGTSGHPSFIWAELEP